MGFTSLRTVRHSQAWIFVHRRSPLLCMDCRLSFSYGVPLGEVVAPLLIILESAPGFHPLIALPMDVAFRIRRGPLRPFNDRGLPRRSIPVSAGAVALFLAGPGSCPATAVKNAFRFDHIIKSRRKTCFYFARRKRDSNPQAFTAAVFKTVDLPLAYSPTRTRIKTENASMRRDEKARIRKKTPEYPGSFSWLQGIELLTRGFSVRCSTQLSYRARA